MPIHQHVSFNKAVGTPVAYTEYGHFRLANFRHCESLLSAVDCTGIDLWFHQHEILEAFCLFDYM